MDDIDYVIHEHPLASGQQWADSVVRVANTHATITDNRHMIGKICWAPEHRLSRS